MTTLYDDASDDIETVVGICDGRDRLDSACVALSAGHVDAGGLLAAFDGGIGELT